MLKKSWRSFKSSILKHICFKKSLMNLSNHFQNENLKHCLKLKENEEAKKKKKS